MSLGKFTAGSAGKKFGCAGCTEPAERVINHPRHGERVVCDGHVNDHEVIRDV